MAENGAQARRTAVAKEEADFWQIVLTNRPRARFGNAPIFDAADSRKQFQIFEVMVVAALAFEYRDLTWRVCQAVKDKGIDFTASREEIYFPGLGLRIAPLLVGQVKRQRRYERYDLTADLHKIRDNWRHLPITAVLFVLGAAKLDEAKLEAFLNSVGVLTNRLYVIDAVRVLALIGRCRDRILPLLANCLSGEEPKTIERFLDRVQPPQADAVEASLSHHPNFAQTGRPLVFRVQFASRIPLPRRNILLVHHPDPAEANPVEVIYPSRLRGKGFEVRIEGSRPQSVDIQLRCFAAGRRKLGQIAFVDPIGHQLIQSVPLGELDFEAVFEPPFLPGPNQAVIDCGKALIRRAAAGNAESLAVTGSGGAGKTKLCEQLLTIAGDDGFRSISIQHPNSLQARGVALRLLIAQLIGVDANAAGVAIADQALLPAGIDPDVVRSLRTLLADATNQIVDWSALTKGVLALLIDALERSPLILHFHDLHWADGDTLAVLQNLVANLRCYHGRSTFGIVMLFEGRSKDSLPASDGTYVYPHKWRNFLASSGVECRELQPWSTKDCEDFVNLVIASQIDANTPIQMMKVPLHQQLIEHVRRHGSGNPMHLVEQIKWLKDLGVVDYAPNGLLYLRRSPPAGLEIPPATEDLIQCRIEFFRTHQPDLVDLLIVASHIGRQVNGQQFDELVRSIGNPNARRLLSGFDMADIPATPHESFSFAHENYFRAFRQQSLSPLRAGLAAALHWYDEARRPSILADRVEHCRLMLLEECPDIPRLVGIGRAAIEEAIARQDEEAKASIIGTLLSIDPRQLSRLGVDLLRYRYLLARGQTYVGSWEIALRQLQDLDDACARSETGEALLYRVMGKALAADVLLGLMRYHEAIAATEEGLRLIVATGSGAVALSEWRAELLHRRAVILWFTGEAARAAGWQLRALTAARHAGNAVQKVIALREIGTNILHRNPRFGVHILANAGKLAASLKKDIHYAEPLIIQSQALMGQLLVAAFSNEDLRTVKGIANSTIALHHVCMQKRDLYDATRCSLVCGAAHALTGEFEEAGYWFRNAIATATLATLHEDSWMARLNAAQVCTRLGAATEAEMHAREAWRSLREGLMCDDWNRRPARMSLLQLPLGHFLRLRAIDERDLAALGVGVPTWLADWPSRPTPQRMRGAKQMPLFVRADADDYFMMN